MTPLKSRPLCLELLTTADRNTMAFRCLLMSSCLMQLWHFKRAETGSPTSVSALCCLTVFGTNICLNLSLFPAGFRLFPLLVPHSAPQPSNPPHVARSPYTLCSFMWMVGGVEDGEVGHPGIKRMHNTMSVTRRDSVRRMSFIHSSWEQKLLCSGVSYFSSAEYLTFLWSKVKFYWCVYW